jgi:hypothetical protein
MSVSSSTAGRSFLRSFMVACVTVVALWIGVVLAFDPYLAFGTRLLPKSVIQPTSRMLGDEQLIKDHLFRRHRPDTVIIGSSRAAYGLDPASPALGGKSTYNLAMLGASLADLEGLAAQVRQNRDHVRRVVIGIDHYMFFQPAPEVRPDAKPDVRRQRMEEGYGIIPIPLQHIQSFLMSSKLAKAIEDIIGNRRRKDTLGEAHANGLMHGTYRFRIADRSRTFEVTLGSLFQQNWYAEPDEASIQQRLRRLAGLLRSTCQVNIKVDVVLSPEHAMLHEAAVLTGQRERREQLRRDVARLMALMSAELPACLRYRDSSGLSDPAMEPLRIPPQAPPQFIEVSHYAPLVGERILLGFTKPDDSNALGIDPANGGLEADIADSRQRLENWRRANPDDRAFVKRIFEASRVRP